MAVTKDTTTTLSDAIVTALNSESAFSFTAVRCALPIFNIKELDTIQVTVIPRSRETTIITRGNTQKIHRIEVGIQKKVSNVNSSTECDSIGLVVEAITDYLIGETIGGYICTDIASILADDSTFAKEHIDQQVYTAVLVATYQ